MLKTAGAFSTPTGAEKKLHVDVIYVVSVASGTYHVLTWRPELELEVVLLKITCRASRAGV